MINYRYKIPIRLLTAAPSSRAWKILSAGFTTQGLSEKEQPWERGARLVKDTKVENKYVEHIRETHDPSQHIKTIEDELKGTIGKALGKQGGKILLHLKAMERERQRYDQLVKDHELIDEVVVAAARKYNEYRKDCLKARWELMVHRQAAGFIVGNHKFVVETFPIGDPLPVANQSDGKEGTGGDLFQGDPKKDVKKTFGDQLDWWQRIGRWR